MMCVTLINVTVQFSLCQKPSKLQQVERVNMLTSPVLYNLEIWTRMLLVGNVWGTEGLCQNSHSSEVVFRDIEIKWQRIVWQSQRRVFQTLENILSLWSPGNSLTLTVRLRRMLSCDEQILDLRKAPLYLLQKGKGLKPATDAGEQAQMQLSSVHDTGQ